MPGNDSVGLLLVDERVPLLRLAADLRPPVQTLVVELTYLFDPFHEVRERFELRPLVVRGVNRHVDVDRLLDFFHRHNVLHTLARRPNRPPALMYLRLL